MKRRFVFVLCMIFLFLPIYFVYAQECQSNSECKSIESGRYCDNNGQMCFTLTEYGCENPGTNTSNCVVTKSGNSCLSCQYGCENGYCKPQVVCPQISVPQQKTGCTYNKIYDSNNCITSYEEKCPLPSETPTPTSVVTPGATPVSSPAVNNPTPTTTTPTATPVTYACKDSDGGINYYVLGCVEMLNDPSFGIGGKKCDVCINNNYLAEYVCENGIYKGDHTYICPDSCLNGACAKGEQVKGQVKCIFENSNSEQKCYGAGEKYLCSGKDSCTIDIIGNKGEQVIWKSSCGGYAYTTIDGNNQEARFNCEMSIPGVKTTPIPTIFVPMNGFKNAYWQCQDGFEEKSGSESSCKPSEIWKSYAQETCKKRCIFAGNDKCEVNSFSVYNECSLKNIINPSVCGNGICESGEGQICELTAAACKEGEMCKAVSSKCDVSCPQDCKKGKEEIGTKLNEKFKLQIGQETKFIDYQHLAIKFNDLFVPKCNPIFKIQETETEAAVETEKTSSIAKYSITGMAITSFSAKQEASSSNSKKCIENGEPYAVLQIKSYGAQEKTEVIKIQMGEKKKVFDVVVSFLDYDQKSKSGVFLVSQDKGEFQCPENCICDISGQVKECKKIEKCTENKMLCQDGVCREKCEIKSITTECKFGCFYENKCLPYGLRVNELYCSINDDMKTQLKGDEKCSNNFECSTNLCLDSKCVSSSLIQKILDWFKNLWMIQ